MADEVDDVLSRIGFDPATSVLTRRQAMVLALRERGLKQRTIAERLDTSRANVAGIEASARENVARARETVAFVDALEAPVRVPVPAETDLYDVPQQIYDACDEAGVKVNYTAPELLNAIGERAGGAVRGREVREPLLVSVTREGEVRVRHDGAPREQEL
ncbi:Tfx family DNA-binding protein [Halococcus thailandensis]|uniref:Transcriptional regulator n=1 Tax=Halococcus thailandensis JCM 13552 TaxID=1227457 RepID=M0N6E9_9EURY|nr:Tfx family DNA-binding protein [Halococcus thailandensis]EMA53118.1 transcriptional regulator [Halococcus thailandensis JCM 13552]